MKLANNHYKTFSLIAFASLFILLSTLGCKKFVEIPPAPNLIVTSEVFADSADATSALLALYNSMMSNSSALTPYNGNITIYTSLSSDELYSTRGIVDENTTYVNAILPANSTLSIFWSNSYSIIYKANACLEGISASTGISTGAKNQMIGEAKLVRAFCYFNLVNLYGAIPLITTTDYKTNAVIPRTSIDSVYQQIISDLTSAQSLLTPNYPSAGRVRPNQYAATALLARVYLYRQQWSNAEIDATQIINSGMYSLSSLNSVFLSNIVTPLNTEPIWQLLPFQVGYETTEGFFFNSTSTTVPPKYVINNFLLNSFEVNDLRKTSWLKALTIGTQTYYYPYKYKLGQDNNTAPKENYMMLRLGEQYLIRAEARAQQGNISGAQLDLNLIRGRAGLPATSASSQSALVTAIFHERQVELFCEWGHRWFDLKRTGQVDLVMGSPGGVCAAKGGVWNTNSQLFPINATQLQANPYLIQNPGY